MVRTYDVCAVVISDLTYDARVWREVRSLQESGRTVALIGCAYEIGGVSRSTHKGVDVVEISLGSRVGQVSLIDRAHTLLRVWREVLRTPAHVYHVHNVHPGFAGWIASRYRGAAL